LRQRHPGAAAFSEHALVGHLVILWPAAEILGSNLLQLLLRVHARGMRRARHRVDRLAAAARARPREILRGVAEGHLDFVPRHANKFRRHTMTVADRPGAVIADPGLNVEPAIRFDHEQAVEADRPGGVRADRNADAANLGSVAFAALRLALIPLEYVGALVQRLLDERTRGVLPHGLRPPRRSEHRLSNRCIDAANLDLV